jgi:hypothetical protein
MRRQLVVLLALTGVALTGCGGSDPKGSTAEPTADSSAPATTTPTAEPSTPSSPTADKSGAAAKQTVIDYFDKFFSRDYAGACELVTKEYADAQIDESGEFGKQATKCDEALEGVSAYAQGFGFTKDTLSFKADATVKGDRATVPAESKGSSFPDTTYELKWNGTRWLLNGEV